MTEAEDELLKTKGDYEESLMQTPTPIKPIKIRIASKKKNNHSTISGGGGFGGTTTKNKKKNSNKKSKEQPLKTTIDDTPHHDPDTIQSILKTIRDDGIVRIDNVLSSGVADNLRNYLIDLRQRSTLAIEEGTIENSQERFADVLLNQNRCDLKIPLGPQPVHDALLDILNDDDSDDDTTTTLQHQVRPSLIRSVVESVFDSYQGRGRYASLWELNCFMSNSGARRQLVHADNVCLEPVAGLQGGEEPILLTCFIALQDIDETMGPTVWMPGTHTIDAHNRFFETGRDVSSTQTDTSSPKNEILKSSKSIIGAPLPKGSCVIFDPRVLHCAGANVCDDPSKTRALFYMSFKNPKIDDPGCPSTSGYGISTAELTMEQLVNDLIHERNGQQARYLALLASSP
jgi:ectoine hydroxylase-related dioxygenase (phytanoyl-CoA dioxygenase family)